MPGRWRSDASPWVRLVMEDFANNTIHDIAVQCAALKLQLAPGGSLVGALNGLVARS